MSISDWAALCVSVITIFSGFAIMVKWLVKHYLSELKSNGGTSLRDEQNRQGESIVRLENRLDEVYRLLIDSK
jgi:hypothetical protein